MSKEFSLLQSLNADKVNETKTQYQTYDIELGIETVKAFIPVNKTDEFEREVGLLESVDSYSLYKLAKKLDGFTEDK